LVFVFLGRFTMRSVKLSLSAGRTTLFTILLFLIMVVGSLASLPAHSMVIENTQCILGQPGAPNGLNCTANDIQLSSPVVQVVDGCDYPGDTATLAVIVDITNTAQTRYDIGVWLSVDGDPNNDGSETGICSVLTIPLYTDPPTNSIQLLDVANEWVNRDGDQCGDVKNQPIPQPPPATNPNADVRNVDMGTVDILCNDSDGDGKINVPLIISWDNQAGNVCTVATDAKPNTASKCSSNKELNIDVPVPAQLIVNKQTIPADPTAFPFNLTGSDSGIAGGFDGDYDFNLANGGTFDSGSGVFTGGLPAGGYVLVENATPGWQGVGTCSSDVDGLNTDPASLTLRPGETVTCDFVNTTTTGILTVRKTTSGGTTGVFDFVVSDSNGSVASPNLDTSGSNPADSAGIVVSIFETYTVTETLDPGFVLTSALCTNGNADPVGTPNLQTGTISGITVLPSDNITCAFTNAPAGSVGITKVSVGGNDTFGFNTTVALPNFPTGDFTVMTTNGTGSLAVPNVQPSTPTYDLTETIIPAGWRFDSAVCLDENDNDVSSGTQPAQGVRFTHNPSQTTNCTVTNVKLGTIVIEKLTNPGGNVTDLFGFSGNIGGLPVAFSLMDGESQSIVNVPVDSDPNVTTPYSISEDDPAPDFELTNISCSSSRGDALSSGSAATRLASINIRAGETVTCTFTNTEQATITVEKEISGPNPNNLSTIFGFTTDFGPGFNLNPSVGNPAQSTTYTVEPGLPYSITEADPYADGWSLISATCGTQGEVVSLAAGLLSQIIPQPGDDLTCTFINAPLGSATIVKNAVGGDGIFGFTGSEEPFNNSGAGFQIDTSVSNTADFTNQLFPNVEYDVQEDVVPANWTLTSVVCSDPTGNSTPTGNEDPPIDPATGALIRAASDETVTCTFTNEADATLTINKVTVPASDNTTQFAFTGTGDINGTNLVGGGSVSTMGPKGTFVAAETPTAGWALTNIVCSGVNSQNILIGGTAGFVAGDTDVSLDLAPGDDAECTFTNTKLGSITITKATVGDTGSFTFQGTDSNNAGTITSPFNLTTAANPGDETVTFNGLLPGTYQFNETVPAGWIIDGTNGDIVCSGQSATPGSNSVSIALADGEDVSCTFTNTKLASLALVKEVTNDNGGTATATEWNLTATGGTNLAGDGGVAATFVALGNYALAESAGPAGYTAGAWNCTDGSLAGSTLTLAAGDVAVCTIINDDDAASLALTKIVTNDNGGLAVATEWTLNAAGPTPIGGAGGVTATPVSAGDYTLTETVGPNGYTASAWSCTGDGTLNGNVLTLALGETAACSITNDDDAASLALVKTVTNNNGGTAVPTNWTLSAAGPTPLSGAGGVVATPVNAGDYTLSEAGGPTGYSAGAWNCTVGSLNGDVLTLALGETSICTINNDDEAARLDLTKLVTNDNGGTAVATEWTLSAAGPTPLSGAGGVAATSVDAGDYTLSESVGPAGYTASAWSCTGGGSLNGAVLTLGNGEVASCSITNDDDAGSLSLTKIVTNDNGGTAVATEWTLSAAGPTPLSGAGGVAATTVDAGDYTLTESVGPAGYSAGAWQCSGGSLNGNVLTISSGESAACSITNDDEAARLALTKIVTNDNGGTAVATEWTLSAAGPTPLSGAGGVAATPVDAGIYTLSESTGPDGYTAGAWSCQGGILNGAQLTLGSGEAASCSITNDDVAPGLTLVKTLTLDNGGTAVVTDWTLSATGSVDTITGVSGSPDVTGAAVTADTYVLAEANGPTGYTAGAWACQGATSQNGNSVVIGAGQSVVCTINNDDEPGRLDLTKIVVNDNGGTAVETEWTLSAAGPTPLSGAGGVAATSVDAGDYTLSESTGPDGYTAGAWSCTGDGTLNGDVLTLGNGEAASCSITNDDVAPGLTLVKTLTLDQGGTAVVTDWTLSATGSVDTITGVSGSPAVTGASVSADTYVLAEANGPTGYTAGAWVCTGATSQNGNSVVIGAGETVVCTINNDDEPATLTLVKTVTNDNEGEAVATEWTLSATGNPSSISGVTGSAAVTAADVFAGTYTLAEANGPLGYTAGAWDCGQANIAGDQLTLENGENVTCTINNDDDPAVINLAKTVNGPATLEANGTYTVVYTIAATNSGGPGKYNLEDTFSPGDGITLNTADAVYVPGTEDEQSGTLGAYPTFVTDEGLAPGLNESWTITANFTVDPAMVDPVTSRCDSGSPAINTGFYNRVVGSATDPDLSDNDTCTGLPEPGIDLAKTVNGPATLEGDGSYTVLYTIVATNTGGPGSYDLVDAFSPGDGITLNTATAVYVPGTEDDQSGTLGAYPNFVTDEGLAAGLNESWTVTANFTVDPAMVDPVTSQCDPANPVINTGFYNAVTGSDTETIPGNNDTCTGLPQGGLTLIKVIDESDDSTGTAVPTDFKLTLTGQDGVHDSGVDYISGEMPPVLVGVDYTVSEAPDQFENYVEQSIQCVDDATQAAIGQPFSLTGNQNVTCTVTNLLNEVVFDLVVGVCLNDAPFVDYDVTTSAGGATEADISWIKNDGSEEVVETLLNQPLSGSILWPGASVVNGVAVAWPGWSCDAQGQNCSQINDGLRPTMKLLFQINPESTVVVNYPPATPGCSANPGDNPEPAVPVPADNPLALLLLTLMLLASGWYFRPASMRRF
jgi:hypothetical protein